MQTNKSIFRKNIFLQNYNKNKFPKTALTRLIKNLKKEKNNKSSRDILKYLKNWKKVYLNFFLDFFKKVFKIKNFDAKK